MAKKASAQESHDSRRRHSKNTRASGSKYQISVLLTGGTFLSKRKKSGLAPSGNGTQLDPLLRQRMPLLCKPFEGKVDLKFRQIMSKDSSLLLPADWEVISNAVHAEFLNGAAAVIVVHGTDTMEFSSGAVAHTFAGDIHARNLLVGPVVFTGAMKSLFDEGTDAIKNFHDAVSVCIWGIENRKGDVFLVFDSQVMPAVRASKVDPRAFGAFEAPAIRRRGVDSLNSDGVQIVYESRYRDAARTLEPTAPKMPFVPGPIVLGVNPLLTAAQLLEIGASKNVGALILMTPGDGNFPDHLHEAAGQLTKRFDKPIVIVSAHDGREVRLDAYAVGKAAVEKAGVIPGGDITHTQSLLKLALLLRLHTKAWGAKTDFVRKCWPNPMVGEIS